MRAYAEGRLLLRDKLFDHGVAYASWSLDSQYLTYSYKGWVWRVRLSDRKEERIVSLKGIPLIGWGWLGSGPNDSIITARDAATQQIYALDWEAP